MKRIIILSLLLTIYGFGTVQPASAIVCGNCSQVAFQIPQFAKEIINTGANLLAQVDTWSMKLKVLVLDPLGNAMIAVTLHKQQSNTINLVTGSLGGNSLLVSNPEQWVKNKGLDVVRISLSDLSQQNGPYTDSLMNSVVGTFKSSNTSLQATLGNINSSSIPNLVQNNLCGDASLTQVAKNDVMKTDGTFDPAELATRKKEIYNSLCVGNPSSNPQLAQRLSRVNSQRPDIAGWDTWLAVTGGDNAYNKSVRATLAISDDVEAKKEAAETDLNRSGGMASPSKCTETVKTTPNSDPVTNIKDAACRTESLTNLGSAVNASFQEAINAPMQRLINSFGSGVIGTLSSLLAAKNTTEMLSNAFSGITGSGGGNVSITIGATSTPTDDLAGNPGGKEAITQPMTERFTTYLQSLDKLEEINSSLLVEIGMARNSAEEINSCYQGLMNDFSIDSSYPGISEALSYYQQRKQAMVNFLASVTGDSTAIPAARAFISDIQARMTQSNSSEEIGDLYTKFEGKIKDKTFPGDMAGNLREAEYQTLKGENQVDSMSEGTGFKLKAQCAAIRQQLTPREQA